MVETNKSPMGQDIQQEWHYQFLGDNGNVKILADRVNDFFLRITDNFADVSKGFDRIDHHILMQELMELDIHPVLYNWINAFLSNRK
jgi:hypothetical protein